MQPIFDKWSTVLDTLSNDPELNFHAEGEASLGCKAKSAVMALYKAITDGWICQSNYSSGKDSESTLNLFLMALILAVRNGTNVSQHHFILHVDTGVENPEVQHLAQQKLTALQSFIEKHQLPLKIIIATPSFAESWVGRILTARTLPTFSNSSARQCSVDLKSSPANRARNRYLKSLSKAERKKVCLILGSRDEEGTKRAKSIAKFGGSDIEVIDSKSGPCIYPVKAWSTENVWEFLMSMGDGKPLPSYVPSHTPTATLYKDATGECIWTTANKQQSRSCGSRFGCYVCQAAGDDKSMSELLKVDDKYEYMKPLYRIQQLIAKTRYDWTKRTPMGRTIYRGGFVRWQPDTYNADFTKKLLHACVSADYIEQQRADQVKKEIQSGALPDNENHRRMATRQFRMVSDQEILLIDFLWCLHGVDSKPFSALKIYSQVWDDGIIDDLSEVDDMEAVPRTPLPKPKWVHVGDDWLFEGFGGGLNDAYAELTRFDSEDGTWTKPMSTQFGERQLIAANEGLELSIDDEAAYFILNYESERLFEKAQSGQMNPAAATHYYLRTGAVTIAKGKLALYDKLAARGQRYQFLGLSGQQSLEGPDPRTGLKCLTTKQYERYIARRSKANIKKIQWWAFRAWFMQANMDAGTIIGHQLKRMLADEQEQQAQEERNNAEVRALDVVHTLLNTMAMVAGGYLQLSDSMVKRHKKRVRNLAGTSQEQACVSELKRIEKLVRKGDHSQLSVGSSFESFMESHGLTALIVTAEVKKIIGAPMAASREEQIALPF